MLARPWAPDSSALNWSSFVLGHFEKVHVRALALPETCTLASTQEVEEQRQEAVAAA